MATTFRMDTSRRSAKMSAWDRSNMAGVKVWREAGARPIAGRGDREESGARAATCLIPMKQDAAFGWLKGELQPPK